jgi:hypothetical protein
MKNLIILSTLACGVAASNADALINVDYTAHLNQNFSVKTGPAVVGNSPSDFWNVYSRDVSSEWDWRANGVVDDLKYSDGSSSGAQLAVFNAPGAWYTLDPDPMYQSYLYPFNQDPIVSEFTQLPAGTYDLYVYAHGQPAAENAFLSLWNGAVNYGTLSTSSNPAADSPGWTEGFEYVAFHNINVADGDKLTLTSSKGDGPIAVINGLQLLSVPEGGPLTSTATLAVLLLCVSGRVVRNVTSERQTERRI